jgi:hypothetical protein
VTATPVIVKEPVTALVALKADESTSTPDSDIWFTEGSIVSVGSVEAASVRVAVTKNDRANKRGKTIIAKTLGLP